MEFQGWPDTALAFYAGLEEDNTKAYWTAHKAVFDADVHAPMLALLDELEPRFGATKLMRPYRDIRFSKDKSPYKTSLGATVGEWYVQVSARGLGAGGGYYHLAPDQLARYRDAVAAESTGGELVRIVDAVEERDVEVIGADPLKTAPRGYPADHPRVELLRCKGLVAWKQWPVEPWLGTAAAKERVVAVFEATAPLCDWLVAHVGPSTSPASRGRRA